MRSGARNKGVRKMMHFTSNAAAVLVLLVLTITSSAVAETVVVGQKISKVISSQNAPSPTIGDGIFSEHEIPWRKYGSKVSSSDYYATYDAERSFLDGLCSLGIEVRNTKDRTEEVRFLYALETGQLRCERTISEFMSDGFITDHSYIFQRFITGPFLFSNPMLQKKCYDDPRPQSADDLGSVRESISTTAKYFGPSSFCVAGPDSIIDVNNDERGRIYLREENHRAECSLVTGLWKLKLDRVEVSEENYVLSTEKKLCLGSTVEKSYYIKQMLTTTTNH